MDRINDATDSWAWFLLLVVAAVGVAAVAIGTDRIEKAFSASGMNSK